MEPSERVEVSSVSNTQQSTYYLPLVLVATLVLLAAAGGMFWYIKSNNTSDPSQAIEIPGDDSHKGAVVPSEEQYVTPSGYKQIEEPVTGVAFDVPENWKKWSEPESGIPSYATQNFSSKSMRITGAYIAYDLFVAPEGYPGTSEEYLEGMKSGRTGWSEVTIDGHKALIHTAGWPNQSSVVNTSIIAKIGDKFLSIHYMDENGAYKEAFDVFLKSFKILPSSQLSGGNLVWNTQTISLNARTIKISDVPAMLVAKDIVYELRDGEFKEALLSPNGTKIVFAARNAAHDFGWVYDLATSEFIPLAFQYGGGVDVLAWKNENEITLKLISPKPDVLEVTFDLRFLPAYPKAAQ